MALFDLEKAQQVEQLLGVAPDARDAAWIERFYEAAGEASMAAGDPQVFSGPDGFPYFSLHLPPIGEGFETYCVDHVVPFCTDNGHGAVIHQRDGSTGWVFPYGVLWSRRATGRFDARDPDDPGGPKVLEQAEDVLVGAPSDEVLPPWARAVLRRVLQAWGVAEPMVALVARRTAPRWSLALTLPDDEQQAHALGWFLPPHIGFLAAESVGASSLLRL